MQADQGIQPGPALIKLALSAQTSAQFAVASRTEKRPQIAFSAVYIFETLAHSSHQYAAFKLSTAGNTAAYSPFEPPATEDPLC